MGHQASSKTAIWYHVLAGNGEVLVREIEVIRQTKNTITYRIGVMGQECRATRDHKVYFEDRQLALDEAMRVATSHVKRYEECLKKAMACKSFLEKGHVAALPTREEQARMRQRIQDAMESGNLL